MLEIAGIDGGNGAIVACFSRLAKPIAHKAGSYNADSKGRFHCRYPLWDFSFIVDWHLEGVNQSDFY